MGLWKEQLSEQLDEDILAQTVDSLDNLPEETPAGDKNSFLHRELDLLTVSTDIADYHINPTDELDEWKVDHSVRAADGIVLESGPYRSYDLALLGQHDQYEKIINATIERSPTSIYLVDSQSTDSDLSDPEEALAMLEDDNDWSDIISGLDAASLLYSIVKKNLKFKPLALSLAAGGMDALGAHGYLKGTNSFLKLRKFYQKTGGRSAVAAQKMEEFISPSIAQENGERPDIYVEYGSDHLDMKHYLKHEHLRNGVAALHDLINKVRSDGEYRDKIGEIRFDEFEDGPVNTVEHDGDEHEYQKIIYEIDELAA